MNLLQKITIGLISLYQILLRPIFPNACVFHAHGLPSCSAYTKQSIQEKGFLKGTLLGMYRIIRCHPWQKHFSDPKW